MDQQQQQPGRSFNPNKHLKEEFVSNLMGSSMLEIAALSAIVSALVVLRQWSGFCTASAYIKPKKNDDAVAPPTDWRRHMASLVMDYLFIVLPILLVFTVLADWVYLCAICLMLFLLFSILVRSFGTSASSSKEDLGHLSSLRMSILSYRVSMMVVTCLCILAVDFKFFPRRYAKTETYGTSLMDLGVGSFVLANSLVSRQARNSMPMKWKDAFQSTSPLIFLGISRLIFTKGVDYQVHVGEYGVHWNFFFTLAAVSILSSVINIHPKYCGIFGSSLLIGYQICLMYGLNEYLLSNKRDLDIISLNKEGLFSIFGYWGMYLVGVHLGYTLFFGDESTMMMRKIQWGRTKVWVLTILFWLLTVVMDKYVERVSRRMCNLPYVTLVLAQNFQVLLILMLSDFIPGQKPLLLEAAFNNNLLGAFLLANILTGTVNLSVDTLSASSLAAFSTLLGYSFVLSSFVGFLGFCGFKLRFW